jgi:DNA transformation protein
MEDEDLRELFHGLGPVSIRRMFGGKGVYMDGQIFALVVSGELMLKADAQSSPELEARGSTQWVYEGGMRKGKVAMPYWRVPDSAYDDQDEMTLLARQAVDAAFRSRKPQKASPSRRRKPA